MAYFVVSAVLLALFLAALAVLRLIATTRASRVAAAKRRAIARRQAQGELRAMQLIQDTVDEMFRAVREQR